MKPQFLAAFTALLMLWSGIPMILPQADLTACAEDVTGEEPEYGYTDEYDYNKYSDHIVLLNIYSGYETVTIPDTIEGLPVTGIDGYYCSNETLRSLYIPDTVTEITGDSFLDCPNLEEIRFPDTLRRIDVSLSGTAWYEKQPDGLICIGKCLYGYKGEMPEHTEIVIPEGIVSIRSLAFYDQSNLTAVTFPESLEVVGSSAFEKCNSISEFCIPANVTEIGTDAFLTATTNTFSIMGSGFGNSNLKAINVAADNPNYTSVDGVLFSKDMKTLLCYPIAKETENNSYTIPDGVKTIGSYAFYASNLGQILFPDSVETIESYSFYICGALQNVTLPPHLKTIGRSAFSNCREMTSIVIPASVTSVGSDAFYYADLDEVTFENSDTEINGSDTFINHWESTEDGGRVYEYTGVIYGKEGSTAQTYAQENQIRFALHKGTEGVFTYNNCIDHIEITAVEYGDYETRPTLDIPAEIEGLPVQSYYGYTVDGYGIVNLPATMRSMTYSCGGYFPFYESTALNVAENSESYTSVDGVLYTKDMKTLICYPECKQAESYAVPEGVTQIASYALDHTRFEKLTLPVSFKTILDGTNLGWNSYIKVVEGYDNTPAKAVAEYLDAEYISLGAAPAEPEQNGDIVNKDNITLGNINGDDSINAIDAQLVLVAAAKIGVGEESGLTDAQITAANTNSDGDVNAADANDILRYAAYNGAGGTDTIEDFLLTDYSERSIREMG